MSRSLVWRFLSVLVWIPLAIPAGAQSSAPPVSIESVAFSTPTPMGGREPWYEIAIEIEGQTRDPAARAEPLQLGLEIAFRAGGDGAFSFYRAEVSLLVPESGDEAQVFFYLPPGLVERDDLRREPFGWRVWLAQGDERFAQAPGTYSDSLRSAEAARSFAQRVLSEAPGNDGWLQPIYLTPFFQSENGRLLDGPSYQRREPAE